MTMLVETTEMITNAQSNGKDLNTPIPKGSIFKVHPLDEDKDNPEWVWVRTGPGNVILPEARKEYRPFVLSDINLFLPTDKVKFLE